MSQLLRDIIIGETLPRLIPERPPLLDGQKIFIPPTVTQADEGLQIGYGAYDKEYEEISRAESVAIKNE